MSETEASPESPQAPVERAEFDELGSQVAKRMADSGVEKIFLDFAEEEIRHKERLLAVKAGERELTPEQEVLDMKISDTKYVIPAKEGIQQVVE